MYKKYTIPVLKTKAKDHRNWYVEFYYLNPETLELERKRYKSSKKFGGVRMETKAKSRKQKLEYYSKLLTTITKKLESGWSPFETKTKTDLPTLKSAMLQGINDPRKRRSEITKEGYRKTVNNFIAWTEKENLRIRSPTQITNKIIKQFLKTKNHLAAASVNGYVRDLRAVLNSMIDMELVQANPLNKIKMLKEIPKTHKPYTIKEARKIMSLTAQEIPSLFIAIAFEYYALMRPSEIRKLKFEHIQIERKTIIIPASETKNSKHGALPMHHDLEIIITGYLEQKKREGRRDTEWVFDNGYGQPVHRHYFSEKWKKLKRLIELREGQTMYGFKHTGAVNLYRATKDIYLVSRMCRHSDTRTTEIYLRSLGENVQNLDIHQLKSIT